MTIKNQTIALLFYLFVPLFAWCQKPKVQPDLGNRPIVVYAVAELHYAGLGIKLPVKKRIDIEANVCGIYPFFVGHAGRQSYNTHYYDYVTPTNMGNDFHSNYFWIMRLGFQKGVQFKTGINYYPRSNKYFLAFLISYRCLLFDEYYEFRDSVSRINKLNYKRAEHSLGLHTEFNYCLTKPDSKPQVIVFGGVGCRLTLNRKDVLVKQGAYHYINPFFPSWQETYFIGERSLLVVSPTIHLGFKIGGKILKPAQN